MKAWLAACALLAHASLAVADGASHTTAPFWQRLREPQTARAQALLRQGRAQLIPALRTSSLLGQQASAHRRVAVEGALARFERARSLLPNDPELLFLTGKALAAWEHELGGRIEQRSREAIDCLLRLRTVDGWYEAEAVAFELGILYTREARFAEAAAEYRRALQMQLDDAGHSATLGNLAEVTMLSGDLASAVRLYERATRESSGSNRLLTLWGLAVALDRLGEHEEAMAVAKRAVRDDQAPMHALEQGSVFFVPAHERHYYVGLGARAQAQLAASELGTRAELPGKLKLASLSFEALSALQRDAGDVQGLGLDPLVSQLHRTLLDELSTRTRIGAVRRDTKGPRGPSRLDANEVNARMLGHLLEALGSFARYLAEAGQQAPWSADATRHVAQLSALVSGTQLGSNAKQQALHGLAERPR